MGKYKNSAISSFLNTDADKPQATAKAAQFAPMEKEERRNRRVHLVMKPSIYEKLKDAAEIHGTSVNHVVESLIEQYL